MANPFAAVHDAIDRLRALARTHRIPAHDTANLRRAGQGQTVYRLMPEPKPMPRSEPAPAVVRTRGVRAGWKGGVSLALITLLFACDSGSQAPAQDRACLWTIKAIRGQSSDEYRAAKIRLIGYSTTVEFISTDGEKVISTNFAASNPCGKDAQYE